MIKDKMKLLAEELGLTHISNVRPDQIKVGTRVFFPERALKVISSGMSTSIATVVDICTNSDVTDSTETFFLLYFDGSVAKKRFHLMPSFLASNAEYDVAVSMPSLRGYEVLVSQGEDVNVTLSAKYVL